MSDNIFGQIAKEHTKGMYIPSKWIIEKANETSYTIVNRQSGDIIAEDVAAHAIAQKMVTLLNDDVRINSKRFIDLLELNHQFDSKVAEYEKTRLDETVKEVNVLLKKIREF